MIMRPPCSVSYSLPWVGTQADLGLHHPGVLGDEVVGQDKTKLLRTGNPILLGQDEHSILLGVSGDDITVVASLVVLVVVQGEEGLNLQLPDSVDRALFGHMKDLNPSLNRKKNLK